MPRPAVLLHLNVLALLALSLVMIQSARMTLGEPIAGVGDLLWTRHTLYALIAVAVMLLASRFHLARAASVRWYRNPLPWCLAVAMVLQGATLAGFGYEVNGATRWLRLPLGGAAVSLQPSELIKWTLVLVLPLWCLWRGEAMKRFWSGMAPPLLLIGVASAMIAREDLGTAVLVAAVGAAIVVAGGGALWKLLTLTPIAVVGVVAMIHAAPFRMRRLAAFADPWADPQGAGYHPIQSMLAFAKGGLAGRGLGRGVQKFGYLPEDTTDFVFPVIAEELGLPGCLLVLGLLLTLLWTLHHILMRRERRYDRLVCLGLLLTLGLQALINLAVVTVLMPAKGIALPLVSAGGTGWVLTAAAIGLVSSFDVADEHDRARGPVVRPDADGHTFTPPDALATRHEPETAPG